MKLNLQVNILYDIVDKATCQLCMDIKNIEDMIEKLSKNPRPIKNEYHT